MHPIDVVLEFCIEEIEMRLELMPREQLDPELNTLLDNFLQVCPTFNPLVFQSMDNNPEVSKAFSSA